MVNRNLHLVRDVRRAATVVVTHHALAACLSPEGGLDLPFAMPATARLWSEAALRRRLAEAPAAGAAARSPYTLEEVARLSGLPAAICAALAVFDVIGDGAGHFVYRDLAAARQAAALIGQGGAPAALIRAAWTLAERGIALPRVRLVEAPWGEIMQQVGGSLARLDGQFALVLDDTAAPDAAGSLAQALASESEGSPHEAERWYRRAAQADRRDPVPLFNLGNLLAGLGRDAEAMIAFQQALARDGVFAEAAFNLAGLHAKAGQEGRAITLLRAIVVDHPAYAQAVYNLARLLTRAGSFADALPFWERFIALAPDDADAGHARRGALLCRLEMRS